MKQKLVAALAAVVNSPAVRKEFVVLLRLAAITLAARFGINLHA